MTSTAKRNIYYAHIYPHLSYANTIWSCHTTPKQCKKIGTIQKYCIRAITNKSISHHTDPMFKSLKIMKFEEIENFELCKLLFCVKEKLLPAPILNMFHTLGKKPTIITQDIKIYLILKDTLALNLIKVFCAKG